MESVICDRKKALENLEKTKKGLPLKKRAKDWWIQGFQINKAYLPHWDEIKDIFNHYEVDLNKQGPIITMQTLKQVRMAKKLTEMVKDDPEIRSMAKNCSFPLRSVYIDYDPEKIIDGTIFIMLLRVIPVFCLKSGMDKFESVVNNGVAKKHLKEIFSTEGTIIETEKEIDEIIESMEREINER